MAKAAIIMPIIIMMITMITAIIMISGSRSSSTAAAVAAATTMIVIDVVTTIVTVLSLLYSFRQWNDGKAVNAIIAALGVATGPKLPPGLSLYMQLSLTARCEHYLLPILHAAVGAQWLRQ